MIPLTLQQIADLAGAANVTPDRAGLVVDTVSTDTRKLAGGELFIALRGEHYDAHDFLDRAVDAGAAALLVESPARDAALATGAGILTVDDTLTSLQRLAHGLRREIDPLIVGVTGSNGKTSVKQFLRAVLSTSHNVAATPGNLNNHIGVPLTLLGLTRDHDALVCEIGMNHPGEIAPLARLAEPDISVITNIGTAHIEFLGSQDAIAREKGELVAALQPDGLAVLNADDRYTDAIAARCPGRVLRAGLQAGEVRAFDPRPNDRGMSFTLSAGGRTAAASIPLPGNHMVANATLAAAVGWSLGIELEAIASALAASIPEAGRLRHHRAAGLSFLDDSYNANPESMRAGILTLCQSGPAGRRIAVLGHMAELGPDADAVHRQLGQWIAGQPVDLLVTIGVPADPIAHGAAEHRPGEWVHRCPSHAEAAAFLHQQGLPTDLILLKGSRTARVEHVIDLLPQPAGAPADVPSFSQ